MTVNGLDAYGALPPAKLGAYDFVARYVSLQPGKCVTPSEMASYRAARKSIVLVYEDNADDGLGGANAGAAKAHLALPILKAIGWPQDRPVHFAFDMPGYAVDLPTFIRCAQAFAAGIGRPAAVYGDVDTCTASHSAGIKYLWQFGEGRAPGITILQGMSFTAPWGQSVDPDSALAEDYGQWPAPVAPKPPKPKPVPKPKPAPAPKLAQTLTGKTSVLGRLTLNSDVHWANYDHLVLSGGGPKAKVRAIETITKYVRVSVTSATRRTSVSVEVYEKA